MYQRSRLITVLVILSPLFNVYEMGTLPISLGEFVLILTSLYAFALIIRKRQMTLKKVSGIYFFFTLFVLFVSLLFRMLYFPEIDNYFISKSLQMIVYLIPLLLVPSFFDTDYGKKIFVNISVILSVFLLVQYASSMILHRQIPGLLNGVRLNYNMEYASEYYGYLNFHNIYRPSSLFIEPAHFAQYVSFGLLMSLFSKSKRLFIIPILLSGALLISGSAIAFVGVAFSWMMWYWFYYVKNAKNYNGFFIIIVITGISIAIASRTDILTKFLYRLSTIGDQTSSTGSLRILRGFYIYSLLPIQNKLLGLGYGNIQAFLIGNGIRTPYDGDLLVGNDYMNSIAYILCGGGLVGIILFSYFCFRTFQSTDQISRYILVLLLVILSVSSIFFSPSYILPVIFTISAIKDKGDNNGYKNNYIT